MTHKKRTNAMKAVAITRTTEPRDVRGAVNTLAPALREDADYRLGWEANIAMAFVDAMGRLKAELGKKSSLNKSEIHQAANEAAAQFLAELHEALDEPNFSDAIDRYCSHTANVRKAFLSGEKK